MHRLVLDLLDLPPKPPRHAAEQRVEREIEREQHDSEYRRHRPERRRGGGGNRPVVLVDLEDADTIAVNGHGRVRFERLRVRPRAAALVVLLMTIGKVFLHDLWDLGALYRVGSILGLAVALLAVSFLTQRFVFAKERP